MNGLVILAFMAMGQVVYLIAATWSLVFSVRTKMALSLLMGSHVVLLFTIIFFEMDWYRLFPHFLYVRVPIPLLIGPSLLLLYQGIIVIRNRVDIRFFLHFVPFLFYVVLMLPYYSQDATLKLSDPRMDEFTWINFSLMEHLKSVHICAYLIWIFIIHRHQDRESKTGRFIAPYRSLFIWVLRLYSGIVVASMGNVILTSFGYNGLYYAELIIVIITTLLASSIGYIFIRYHGEWQKAHRTPNTKKHKEEDQVVARLIEIMNEEKLYRNCDLKISDVATSLGIQKQNLSEIINSHLDTNFSQLVNTYRLEDFKSRVANPGEDHKTLVGLAYESGFNSKSSFQRIFKEATGMTPKAYKKSARK